MHLYRIIEPIGAGQFGQIFKGEHIITREKVAIKIQPNNQLIRSLQNEAKVYRQLIGQPGFAALKAFQDNMLVLELLGPSMANVIQHVKVLGIQDVLLVGVQLISRVQTLHNLGYIHRDIKPDNVMLGVNSNKHVIYLIDFGLCTSKTKTISSKSTVGSLNFVSSHVHQMGPIQDDLESCMYVLIYLYFGTLSWFSSTNPHDILTQKINLENVVEVPAVFKEMLKYIRSQREPSYGYLTQLMNAELNVDEFGFYKLFD